MDKKYEAQFITPFFGRRTIFMDKNRNLYKMCKGCSSYGSIFEEHDGIKGYNRACNIEYPILTPTVECPCIKCLIKGICDTGCPEYNDFRLYEMTFKKEKLDDLKKKLKSRKRN